MSRFVCFISQCWRCLPKWDRWFSIPFVFMFFALVGWVPELYIRATEIPPIEKLQRDVGEIFFESGGRGGWITKLRTAQGVMQFSCWTGGRSGSCVVARPAGSLKEWQNRPATILWFSRATPYAAEKFAVQVEVDGVTVLDYHSSVRNLAISKRIFPAFSMFYFLCPFVYLFIRVRSSLRQNGGGAQ